MDFDTTSKRKRRRPRTLARVPNPTSIPSLFGSTRNDQPPPAQEDPNSYTIPAGAKKPALVHLALAAWTAEDFDPTRLGEVRGRKVEEAGLRRALYRSSIGEIEHAIGPALKGKNVIVEGRLAGTARSTIERLGASVTELKLDEEKRYIDMTPAIFVLAAVAMAVRYVSLGLDDQDLYILAGLGFALMYGLRSFFKMQRPRD